MEQRVEMVGNWLQDEASITELSRIYGVSRVTIYKWLKRFKAEGPEGFREHSRAPHQHPNAVPTEIVRLLVSARLSHQRWGPKKIQKWLRERYPDEEWPS